jgi:hypothetical protein
VAHFGNMRLPAVSFSIDYYALFILARQTEDRRNMGVCAPIHIVDYMDNSTKINEELKLGQTA